MTDLTELVHRHDHVLLRREAVAAGIDDKHLGRAVRAGHLRRLRHGLYVDAATWSAADATTRHLLLARGVRRLYGETAALSHVSAALAYGVPTWRLPFDAVHLTHFDRLAGRRQARVVHHRGVCRVDDLTRDRDGWLTTPARTFVDMAKTLPPVVALVIADWLLHEGLATRAHLWAALDSQEESPHTLHVRSVIAAAEPLTESVGETRTRAELRRAGLPRPVPQFVIRDRTGRFVARVDFAWPGLGVILEFDGLVKYDALLAPGQSALDVVRAEKRRDRDLAALGWTVVRVEWADLARPEDFIARVRAVLHRAAN